MLFSNQRGCGSPMIARFQKPGFFDFKPPKDQAVETRFLASISIGRDLQQQTQNDETHQQ